MQSYILNNYACVIHYKFKSISSFNMEDRYVLAKTFELAYNSFINPIVSIEEAIMGNMVLCSLDSMNNQWEIYLLKLTEELLNTIYLKYINIQLSISEKDFTLNFISVLNKDGMLDLNNSGEYFNIIKNNDKYKICSKFPVSVDTLDDILIQLCNELHCYSNVTTEYDKQLICKIKDSIINNKVLDIFECDGNHIVNYFIKFK